MLEMDVIESMQAEWVAPLVFAPKKDETLQFCKDYHKLDPVSIRDFYPILCLDECIDSSGDALIFYTLDGNSGYWPVEVSDRAGD